MVGKPPLMSMVLRWFLVSKTIGSNGFPMVFGPKTIVSNCFSNGFWSKNHWYQWFFNGFVVRQPLDTMVFQWFPMVANHWSDDGMATIHRSGSGKMSSYIFHCRPSAISTNPLTAVTENHCGFDKFPALQNH